MSHPDAVTPEGWRIGAGFAEFLHGVGHGELDGDVAGDFADGIFRDEPDDTPAVCEHGRDDYCRPCLVRERADERYLGR